MRREFNVQRNQDRRHPERSEADSKAPVEMAVGFATGFLDFARNDSKDHAQASSGGGEAACLSLAGFGNICR
jgi:hypothetical protein